MGSWAVDEAAVWHGLSRDVCFGWQAGDQKGGQVGSQSVERKEFQGGSGWLAVGKGFNRLLRREERERRVQGEICWVCLLVLKILLSFQYGPYYF